MDSEPALDPHQDHLDRLQDFGFNEHEARFLCLAATHSGYFTRHQFLSFTHRTKGCLVHRFTTKLLTRKQSTGRPIPLRFRVCGKKMAVPNSGTAKQISLSEGERGVQLY